MNLADDLQTWLTHDTVGDEVLAEVRQELQEIIGELDSGEPISAIPSISVPSPPTRDSRRERRKSELPFDDDIPF